MSFYLKQITSLFVEIFHCKTSRTHTHTHTHTLKSLTVSLRLCSPLALSHHQLVIIYMLPHSLQYGSQTVDRPIILIRCPPSALELIEVSGRLSNYQGQFMWSVTLNMHPTDWKKYKIPLICCFWNIILSAHRIIRHRHSIRTSIASDVIEQMHTHTR